MNKTNAQMNAQKKINISLTVEDINNLMVFLDRTDLKGKEVQAYNSIMFKIEGSVKNAEEDARMQAQMEESKRLKKEQEQKIEEEKMLKKIEKSKKE